MSYCRFSSDNWKCDLYCWEGGGWHTHVAGNRIVGEVPGVPHFTADVDRDAWTIAHDVQMKFLNGCERTEIDLLHAGDTFLDETLEGFEKTLLMLRALGYRFPDRVLTEVHEELAAERAAKQYVGIE